MSLIKASVWTALSTFIKIVVGLIIIKLLATSFGPSGVGLAGNFRQLITVLGVISGAGIFNGVTRLVSKYGHDKYEIKRIVGTSLTIVIVFSSLFAVFLILMALPISYLLFGDDNYTAIIYLTAFVQMAIAWTNLWLAIIKGFREAFGYALTLSIGSVIGVIAYLVSAQFGGYQGALLGLALVPAMVILPATVVLIKRIPIPIRSFIPCWDVAIGRHLGKFTLMVLMTTVTLPIAYIMIRNQLAQYYDWSAVGLWQGVTSISDAYLQLITASFSVYLLPILARMNNKKQISREIISTLKFVIPILVVTVFVVWILRDFIIWLLFTEKFTPMRALFVWQLIGDIFKVAAYVFGYLVVAKAALRIYLLAELSQFLLLITFSHQWIPLHGAEGAVQAYMATYIVYFTFCCIAFIYYCRRP